MKGCEIPRCSQRTFRNQRLESDLCLTQETAGLQAIKPTVEPKDCWVFIEPYAGRARGIIRGYRFKKGLVRIQSRDHRPF